MERGAEGNDVEAYTNECMGDAYRDLVGNGQADLARVFAAICEQELSLDLDDDEGVGLSLVSPGLLLGDDRLCGQCEGTGKTQSCDVAMEEEYCPVCDGTGVLDQPAGSN